ncbi:MAG TPA: ABC transporter permease [Blastocatellia bacterium]|nr:ABC transporter permease [Blastocatellia bacterium]
METLLRDLTHGTRALVKSPFSTGAAILALALGIGATSAIFTVVNTVLLRKLPYADPDRIVNIAYLSPGRGFDSAGDSYSGFVRMRDDNQVFESLAGYTNESLTLVGGAEPEQLTAIRFSGPLFHLLGVNPIKGRDFLPEEDKPGGADVAIISYALWQRRFASDPAIIGKPVTMTGSQVRIVGVMPPDFRFPDQDVDVWVPRVFEPSRFTPEQVHSILGYIFEVGRLKKEIDLRQAVSSVRVTFQSAARQNGSAPKSLFGLQVDLSPVQADSVRNVRLTLQVLMAAVVFVLFIACANVATLLMARGARRHKEIAVRSALGASRSRIIAQLLTENAILALSGGGIGLLLANWSLKFLLTLTSDSIPHYRKVSIDWRVLGFTLAATLITGLLFGIAPAIKMSKLDLAESLKDGGRGTSGERGANRLRRTLIVAEIALALVLLSGAGLAIRSFINLQQIDPGFNPNNLLTMRISLSRTAYPEGAPRSSFFASVLDRVKALPGVESAAATMQVPPNGYVIAPVQPEGSASLRIGERPVVQWNSVTPAYFKTLGVSLLQGRLFAEEDNENRPPVAVINQRLAAQFWPGQNPLGKHIVVGRLPDELEIAGVVADHKNDGLNKEPRAAVYTPYRQRTWPTMYLIVRTERDPLSAAAAISSQVWSVDRSQPVTGVSTMSAVLSASSAQSRFVMFLLGLFASVALVLAIAGIYSVIAYSVSERSNEIAIRMALGASAAEVQRMVVKSGFKLAMVGTALGLAGASILTRTMSSLLYNVNPVDAMTFGGVSILLGAVAILASYIPARRAAATNPIVTLHQD